MSVSPARLVQNFLHLFGYQLVRNIQPKKQTGVLLQDASSVIDDVVGVLSDNNDRLLDLRTRYRSTQVPMSAHTWWSREYVESTLDLKTFRSDNVYVWQARQMGEEIELRYYLYLQDVKARDYMGLLDNLEEDGAFGCWVFTFNSHSSVSRDLLDSVNEINFLEKSLKLSSLENLNVLDVGAGYGRLAHRMCKALTNINKYYCVDAIPESTFLSEFYLDYRGVADKASVVPLDELDTLPKGQIDLAINVHSFSEMSLAAVEGWLDLLIELKIPRLFVIPNDSEAFLTMESDGTRRDFLSSLKERGFRKIYQAPVIADPDARRLMGIQDNMFLFEVREP